MGSKESGTAPSQPGAARIPGAEEVAARLRELRLRAGSPSFRELAKRSHYSASTLADATAGKRLPTEAVVTAFVRACGEDPETLVALLREARSRCAADPEVPAEPDPPNPTDHVGMPPRGAPRRRVLLTGAALLLLAAGGVIGAVVGRQMADNPPTSLTPMAAAPPTASTSGKAADGSDPVAAGCTSDAVLADKAPLLLGSTTVGAVELRFSARCQAGWARAYLYPIGSAPLSGALVTVQVAAADGTAAAFSYHLQQTEPVYTDVVAPHGGCLSATATISPIGQPPLHADTSCDAPPAGAATAS